jgi:hypothetical protein
LAGVSRSPLIVASVERQAGEWFGPLPGRRIVNAATRRRRARLGAASTTRARDSDPASAYGVLQRVVAPDRHLDTPLVLCDER